MKVLLGLVVAVVVATAAQAGEPALPEGLESRDEPALPEGLDAAERQPEPALPEGLDGEPPAAAHDGVAVRARDALPFDLHGFLEGRVGLRTQSDPDEKTASIGELRLQLEADRAWRRAALSVTADFLYDPVFGDHDIDLETGRGAIDLREANLLLRPLPAVDVKIGRQILTWGTGDLIFLNDLFPKDFQSFFIGRDDEYLKAPSDAVKASLFSRLANLDVVYTPRFDADRFIDGSRLSYFNESLGRRAGRDAVLDAERPDDWLQDDEVALRLYRNVAGWELAAYAYDGFWKSPAGMDPVTTEATFPALAAYGASVRGAMLGGIANAELAYYDSKDDRDGDDPLVRNSELRVLGGFEREVATELTAGIQYYLQRMRDAGAYEDSLPEGTRPASRSFQIVTVRITQLLLDQNLTLSLFTFYSPSEDDAHLRPKVSYKATDRWRLEVGANVFVGRRADTFFGQLERNTNIYTAARYSF